MKKTKKKKKERSALDLLPKSSMDFDEWKRTYSNQEIRPAALPWLWEHFDYEGYSFWIAEKKDCSEYTKNLLAVNLLGGWMQRLDKLRKYGFGSLLVFGDEPKLEILCVWLFRGLEVPKEMSDVDDYILYDWKKLDSKNEADRKLIEDFFAWNGDFGGNRLPFHDKGKIFK